MTDIPAWNGHNEGVKAVEIWAATEFAGEQPSFMNAMSIVLLPGSGRVIFELDRDGKLRVWREPTGSYRLSSRREA